MIICLLYLCFIVSFFAIREIIKYEKDARAILYPGIALILWIILFKIIS